jgi:hypothetical protein
MRIVTTFAMLALSAAITSSVGCRSHGGTESAGRLARADAERIALGRTSGLRVLNSTAEGPNWLVEVLVERRGTRAEVEIDSSNGRVVSVATREPPDPDDPTEPKPNQRSRGP